MRKTQKISGKLYQFKDETALVIVAAKQEGRIYRASNGEIELLEEFRISTPKFSDNEGMPEEAGHMENATEDIIRREYLEHFKTFLHSLASSFKPNHVYLFAPTHTAGELEKIIDKIFGDLPTKPIIGIFTKEPPSRFLDRL